MDMRTLSFILLILLLAGCQKEKPLNLDNVTVGKFIKANYLEDSKQLYLREILSDKDHPNYNNAILDKNGINQILRMFQLIYNLNSPETDTVFNIYNIHVLACRSLNSIILKVDVSSPEIINLAKGNVSTGNIALDKILTDYEFDSVKTAYSYPKFPWLSIYTKKSYNLMPIMKGLEKIPSILMAENNGSCFDGNDIRLKQEMNKATINFSIGRGDCPAGCIYRRSWNYIVTNKAYFLGTK